jgi:hypothetical protein
LLELPLTDGLAEVPLTLLSDRLPAIVPLEILDTEPLTDDDTGDPLGELLSETPSDELLIAQLDSGPCVGELLSTGLPLPDLLGEPTSDPLAEDATAEDTLM